VISLENFSNDHFLITEGSSHAKGCKNEMFYIKRTTTIKRMGSRNPSNEIFAFIFRLVDQQKQYKRNFEERGAVFDELGVLV